MLSKRLVQIFAVFLTIQPLLSMPGFATEEPEQMTIVRMTPKQSEADASHSYLVELLRIALAETEPEFGPAKIEFMPISLNQGLILHLMDVGDILDVVASAPTHQREIQFRAARVPLLMGLLGYRMMLIKPEDQDKFANIESPEELKQLRACQGSFWPDADILEQEGYRVVRADEFATLFELLLDGQCDYFPRAITEGYGELTAHNAAHPDRPVVAFDDILLHYVVPFYFFSSHQNYELAARLQLGLERGIAKGTIRQLMEQHQVTRVAFPLERWQQTTVFEVPNHDLPKSTPLYRKELWLELPVKERIR
ncbi:transporter substrate-binding domain-containing protein [Neiella marina]|uniref:Transporter substrate-binding domain-containing protein n=1 Tax=Neiella holothuriorum TaxID=2870530 RepID=A0ABS7EIS2_9GAMM|nr:transporter substrate-binding domain-containing protein [Neiella holothuriorum]MBW8192252.1 transporter substrate-binding domain-containing protein [Neiella holothuriorum]